MKQELPIEFSYKVTNTFYAGEYPFEKLTRDGIKKLNRLIDFGIKHFIDLTEEPLTKYQDFLPEHCTYTHRPIIDCTFPEFSILKEIHTKIDEAERLGEKIYVHCKGGYDRTGVVVATYFIHAGFSPSESQQKFHEVFVAPVRGRYPHRPLIETNWEFLNGIENGYRTSNESMANIEPNYQAVRVLWEGINTRREFRRVLYFPYTDGFVHLLVTDKDNKTVNVIEPKQFCSQYMPMEYRDDLPFEYQPYKPDPENR